ncbi:hypothetical protein Pint_18726 [Pistacia integerrima]|uniref:Uncharacterized protein n=1 Tax=Pistacia integerrima TaxID=434235 RepID=A0ACC0YUE6_9ROSI|nr:hypothetical protein Pint_18726 [Pistacia integerrima]
MKRVCCAFVLVVAMLVVLFMASKEVCVTSEAACNPTELMPCLPAVTSPAKPTELCCDKLKSQMQCLCGYLKDPSFGHLVDSHVAQKFSTVCGVSMPKC